jgi:hypothetical protein
MVRMILARRVIICLALLIAVFPIIYPLIIMYNRSTSALPHSLTEGDSWNYQIVFPDALGYQLSVSVRNIVDLNGIHAYVIMYDDAQHMSTQYFWITPDWCEVRTFKPRIGNLLANSTIIYSPPVQLYRLPFHIGDQWIVNSTLETITKLANTTITSTERLMEVRNTSSIEDVSTPFGQFRAFKVTVMQNGTISERLWFSTSVGQVVYGEYYNNHEKVTQTLTDYKLNTDTSGASYSFSPLAVETLMFQQYRSWKTFANYI